MFLWRKWRIKMWRQREISTVGGVIQPNEGERAGVTRQPIRASRMTHSACAGRLVKTHQSTAEPRRRVSPAVFRAANFQFHSALLYILLLYSHIDGYGVATFVVYLPELSVAKLSLTFYFSTDTERSQTYFTFISLQKHMISVLL